MRTVGASAAILVSVLIAACAGGSTPAPVAANAPAPGGVFASAAPYSNARPEKSAARAHAAKGAAAPGGTPCLSCHKAGGSAPAFAFAGTVYTDDARSAPNGDAEIAVADASGKEQIAHADEDGNFWMAGAALTLPGHAGARQGAKVVKMGGAVDSADCNGCHDAKFPVALTPPK
jgi:hypothetical protein